MNVLITGANGFIGNNLRSHLEARNDIQVSSFTRQSETQNLPEILAHIDFVFHLAGVNRPSNELEFQTGNSDLTATLCAAIKACGKAIPVLYASSSQAELDNAYGRSKREAEKHLLDMSHSVGSELYLYRLTNVFGKWAKPNYNSVVATFCYNISRNLPIQINDAGAVLELVYIDDVIASFIAIMDSAEAQTPFVNVTPVYTLTVGELAGQLTCFRASRETLITEAVGTGLTRALYATYISYLPPDKFSYDVPRYEDARGEFVEMLKTSDSGQMSFFSAHPGITRGGHYHHSKTEKFLVIRGKASFKFRHILTQQCVELISSGAQPQIVETAPGWTHDITNIGDTEMIVMLWANEIFDRENPDTYSCPVTVTSALVDQDKVHE